MIFDLFQKTIPLDLAPGEDYDLWRSGLPAHLRTRLKEAPCSFRATRDVMLSASHVAATALLHQPPFSL